MYLYHYYTNHHKLYNHIFNQGTEYIPVQYDLMHGSQECYLIGYFPKITI